MIHGLGILVLQLFDSDACTLLLESDANGV